MDEKTAADFDWARALLHRVVKLALLRIAFDFVQLAKEQRP